MIENPFDYRWRSIGLGNKRCTNMTQCTSELCKGTGVIQTPYAYSEALRAITNNGVKPFTLDSG